MERFKYSCGFERAVSLLSIAGYYLEDFIEDENSEKREYPFFRRTQKNEPAGIIERDGFLKVSKKMSRREKEYIRRFLENNI